MKIIAKTNVQLGGHIYARGEACEYDGAVTARIAANFTDETGRALTVGARGIQGPKGEPGEQGPKGEPGEQGPEGEPGAALTVGAKDVAGAANPGGAEAGEKQGELFGANDVQARIDKTIQVLGRQGIMQALEDMGITFQSNASNKHLAKLLLTSQGEIKAEE